MKFLAKTIDWTVDIPKHGEELLNNIVSHRFPIEYECKLSIWKIDCEFNNSVSTQQGELTDEVTSYHFEESLTYRLLLMHFLHFLLKTTSPC